MATRANSVFPKQTSGLGMLSGTPNFGTSDETTNYNPDLVAKILASDREKPEATFTNVIDMMDWLQCD